MRTLPLLAFLFGAAQASAQGSPAPANKAAATQQPTGTRTAPTQTKAAPTQTKAAPTQTKSAPTQTQAVPTQTKSAPTQAQTKTAQPSGAQTKTAPATGTQTKAAAPAGAQTKAAPAQGTQTKAGAPPRSALTVAPETAPQTRVPVIMREVFEYDNGGRRDPFISLLNSAELRPTVADLRLVGVLYDESGRRPVAVMRDIQTNTQYRVTTGMTLGRMRVSAIKRRSIVFTIEEFGLNRQDSLWLGDSTKVRAK